MLKKKSVKELKAKIAPAQKEFDEKIAQAEKVFEEKEAPARKVETIDFPVFIQDGDVGKYRIVEKCERPGCDVRFPVPLEVNSPASLA